MYQSKADGQYQELTEMWKIENDVTISVEGHSTIQVFQW